MEHNSTQKVKLTVLVYIQDGCTYKDNYVFDSEEKALEWVKYMNKRYGHCVDILSLCST